MQFYINKYKVLSLGRNLHSINMIKNEAPVRLENEKDLGIIIDLDLQEKALHKGQKQSN